MKAVVAAFNQEKALVGAFSVITNLRMDLFWSTSLHMSCRALMDAEYRHAETDFQVHDTTGNLTLTTQGLERRLCQEKYKFWHFIYQLIIWYFSNSDIFIYVLSSNVKNVKTL